MNNDEVGFFALIAMAVFVIMSVLQIVLKSEIRSGENFIMGDATYVCSKTNELKEGK